MVPSEFMEMKVTLEEGCEWACRPALSGGQLNSEQPCALALDVATKKLWLSMSMSVEASRARG